jgi:hypothetical protein
LYTSVLELLKLHRATEPCDFPLMSDPYGHSERDYW